jgi:hypothetical protein
MPGEGWTRLIAHLCVVLAAIACIVLATDERALNRQTETPDDEDE